MTIPSLMTHMTWADSVVWSVVLHAPAARGDVRLRTTLHHMHLVQDIFRQAWQQQPMTIRQEAEFTTIEALAAFACDAGAAAEGFATAVSPLALDEEFREPWTEQFEARWGTGFAGAHTLGESMMQVALHTAHHRGQVCTRLRELGAEPPTVDFIVWLWSGRPMADWVTATAA